MLKTQLLHPQIMAALARAGHSSKVLISDGNYPHWTKRGPNAEMVYLNLAPGMFTVTDVLKVLLTAIPVEKAEVMEPMKSGPYALKEDPPIWNEFRQILHAAGNDFDLDKIERFKFYEVAAAPDVCLTIATGEQRIYANLMLTIGVVRPPK
jgi:L-fucose mutarotase